MKTAIIFDCEYLVSEGAQARYWCGPYDPDPVVVQIGAVKLGLEQDFPIIETKKLFVTPVDRNGDPFVIDPFFTELTGISDKTLQCEGTDLRTALENLNHFAGEAKLWSWGKDELNLVAISCFIANIAPVIPAVKFGNACNALLKAGMPYQDIKRTRSNGLAAYFNIDHPPLVAHDALSVAYVMQYLLSDGRLSHETL